MQIIRILILNKLIKGINLIDGSKNSASKIYWLLGKINKALPQKSEPKPTNMSRLI